MHASQDSDTPTTQVPPHEFFGGIDPEQTAGITPELEDPDRVIPVDPAPHDDDDDSFFTSVMPGEDDDEPQHDEDEVIPIPEGHYHLERGSLVVPLVQIDDGSWQDTFMLKTLQRVGVKHRVGLRAPMPGFCFSGKWAIVEALEQALLVRVDDLVPFGERKD
jgi:hypothetical protein